MNYKKHIDNIPDFPKPGILYRDIQPLLADPEVFNEAIVDLGTLTEEVPDYWVGIESRGFLFASALSMHFGGGIKMIRKWNKLPKVDLVQASYQLEYGVDIIEMKEGTGSVVIVDDVYATGGTINAAKQLVEEGGYTLLDTIALVDIGIGKEEIKSVIKYEK
jgi:adenine phosphoribosyltransferase|tara:strand:+ start:924 stop:1409 length:486 start_codon:yes stop_codon:yes gene_type:complete